MAPEGLLRARRDAVPVLSPWARRQWNLHTFHPRSLKCFPSVGSSRPRPPSGSTSPRGAGRARGGRGSGKRAPGAGRGGYRDLRVGTG